MDSYYIVAQIVIRSHTVTRTFAVVCPEHLVAFTVVCFKTTTDFEILRLKHSSMSEGPERRNGRITCNVQKVVMHLW